MSTTTDTLLEEIYKLNWRINHIRLHHPVIFMEMENAYETAMEEGEDHE